MTFTVALPKKVDDELAAAIEDQGAYVAPEVTRVRVTAGRDALLVEYADGTDEAALRRVVEQFVNDFARRFRRSAGVVHSRHQRRDDAPLERGVFAELVARGWARQLGAGQVGLSGPALRLALALDDRFRRLGVDGFAAAEQSYPSLIPADVLRRCGYFTSFPHLVNLVCHFVEDYGVLERVRQANAESGGVVVPPDSLAAPDACFTPATCYHCYQALEGETVTAPGAAFTAVGRCARYELTNMVGLDRLWEFTMREIIFVGTDAWVTENRAKAMDELARLVDEWDLDCSIESASDPFFAPMYATKTFWQAQGHLKFEGRLAVEPRPDGSPRTIAAASFNLHEGFFGETFSIGMDGAAEPVCTGCAGFGIERWVLAFFTQHGYEPARWPASLRDAVFVG